MGNVFYFDWEVSLIQWLQANMGPVGEAMAKGISFIGSDTVMVLMVMVILFCYKKEAGKRCAYIIALGGLWFPMIKNIVLRIRPYMAHEGIKVLQKVDADADAMDIVSQGYSFPSGHCVTSVAIYGGLAREVKKRWMWTVTIILVLLIGISRIAVGVHYPTDVLAGWAVGLAAIGFGILLEKVKKDWVRSLILAAVTVPGIFWCTTNDYFTFLGLMIAMVFTFPFEKRKVNFQDTRNPVAMILRLAGAMAIYVVLNTVLKLPFSKKFLENGTLVSHLVRSARYAIILFAVIGIYPMCFPLFEKVKIGKKG